MESIHRPKNVEMLTVPKTNGQVWKELKPATKELDLSFQKIQNMTNKAMTPILPLMDAMKEKRDKKALGH